MKRYALSHSPMRLLAALLVFFPLVAEAAVPGAGQILQEIQPVKPPVPSSGGTGLTIQRSDGSTLPPSAPFEVKTIRITGNTLFDTPTLHALVADAVGKSLTLAQLNELAARITDYYQRNGYPLARAIIPAQVIREGMVTIEVVEARYGKVSLENSSRVNDPLLQDTLAADVQGGAPIAQTPLDHALLLLSDIPGVAVSATLKPGDAVGTSDLVVTTTPSGPFVTGNVMLDNYGNSYTGRPRLGLTVNLNNPLHHGDVLSLSGLSSGSGMNYGRIGYETLVNGRGTRAGGSYSALHYILGSPLAALNAHGTAEVASVWVRHPLLRSREFSLYGQLQYDWMQLQDRIDATAIRTDRTLNNWTAGVSGDARDTLLAGAVNTWNVSFTTGRVGFDDPAAQLADAATANTQGTFSKWNANLARLQGLSAKSNLYISLAGQWADGNLDASKKMIAGGPYTVRAYDIGAVSGDSGYLGTAELRYDLGAALSGKWQAMAFVDSAHVTVNQNAWVAGTNSATLSGAGVGLNWAGPYQWSARAYIATPIGGTPALIGSTSSSRIWAEISKAF